LFTDANYKLAIITGVAQLKSNATLKQGKPIERWRRKVTGLRIMRESTQIYDSGTAR